MKLGSLLTVFGAGVGYASQEVTADMFPPLSDMLDADTIDKLLLPCAAAAIGCLDHANVDISALFAKVIPPESITPLITCSLEAAYDNEALFGDCITVLGETEIGRVAETCRAELETCEGEGVQSDGILWCVHEAADEGNNFSCLTETSAVVGVTFVAPTPSPGDGTVKACEDFSRHIWNKQLKADGEKLRAATLCDCQDLCVGRQAHTLAYKENPSKPHKSVCYCYTAEDEKKKNKTGYILIKDLLEDKDE